MNEQEWNDWITLSEEISRIREENEIRIKGENNDDGFGY